MTKKLRRNRMSVADFYARRIAEVESGEDELYRPPHFKLYAKEFLTGDAVDSFDGEQLGWYIRLLCMAWNSRPQGTLPDDQGQLKMRAKYFQDIQLRTNGITIGITIANQGLESSSEAASILVSAMRYEERWQAVIGEFEAVPGVEMLLHHPKLTAVAIEQWRAHQKFVKASRLGVESRLNPNGEGKGLRTIGYTNGTTDDTTDGGIYDEPLVRPSVLPSVDLPYALEKKREKEDETSSKKVFDPIAHFPKDEPPNKKGRRINPDWQPTEALKDFCMFETPDLDLEVERQKFIDYWIAVPGKAGCKLDWQATFRNHLRRYQQFANDRKRSPMSEAERLLKRDAEEAKRNETPPVKPPKPPEHHPLYDDE